MASDKLMVYTFAFEDFREAFDAIAAELEQLHTELAVALGRQEALPRGNLSGVALEMLFQPLIEKITAQRRTRAQAL